MKTVQALLAILILLAVTPLAGAAGQTSSTASASLKVSGTNELTTNAVSTLPNLTTTKGKTYKRFKVLRVEPDGLNIMHSSGIVKVSFGNLPESVQKEYGYDPAKAAAWQQDAEAARAVHAAEQQTSGKLRSHLDSFMGILKSAGIDNSIISSASAEGDKLTIVVANPWHYEPYQVRLQVAQNLWKVWAGIRSPQDPDKARIEFTDFNGNSVGGSRWLGGSLIWVKKD